MVRFFRVPGRWVPRYALKLAAQKVLGATPGMFRVQEWYKAKSGRWRSVKGRDFACQRADSLCTALTRARVPVPGTLLEQGTGWHGIDLVLFYLMGTDRIITYDVRPWLNQDLLRVALSHAPAMANRLRRSSLAPAEIIEQRLSSVDDALMATSLDGLLSALNVEYVVTPQMRRPEVDDGSVDLFYSASVLQRLPPQDLSVLLNEGRRVLVANGVSFHQIDCKDFHSITDPRVPELAYLWVPDPMWRAMTSRYLNYQNRLRCPDFLHLFESAGFESQVVWRNVKDVNLDYLLRSELIMGRLGGMNARDAAVSQFEVRSWAR